MTSLDKQKDAAAFSEYRLLGSRIFYRKDTAREKCNF